MTRAGATTQRFILLGVALLVLIVELSAVHATQSQLASGRLEDRLDYLARRCGGLSPARKAWFVVVADDGRHVSHAYFVDRSLRGTAVDICFRNLAKQLLTIPVSSRRGKHERPIALARRVQIRSDCRYSAVWGPGWGPPSCRECPKRGIGTIDVRSNQKATVAIDGRAVGTTPLSIRRSTPKAYGITLRSGTEVIERVAALCDTQTVSVKVEFPTKRTAPAVSP